MVKILRWGKKAWLPRWCIRLSEHRRQQTDPT